ncbi:type 1 glutamine amidotransferase domain-containing protein [Bacteroides sp.]|uniref:type 1 glutamine amidotransferase domain-containing protein n=1 Tax=Bacteroides sp. TaxID=29523 RepID=UPI00260BD532|nr:type 1 glutamine amidotransferase domain-containing protein [Bacteroides sp.]MDD3037695.1 type 1 glutamine amidotransferase domain-containing protein [Bacteroides sp.]
MDNLKMLAIVTGTSMYASGNIKTGLWLSELTHIYHSAKEQGYEFIIASPKGGNTPIDPESLKPMVLDKLSKYYWNDSEFREMLQRTKSLDEVSGLMFDCVYLAGGHGTMYDFPDNMVLQKIIKDHYENNKIVAAICHGVGGLLNVKLSNGDFLIKDKKLTGFTWCEESIVGRKKEVPFDLEAALKERGADYQKALIPMTSKVFADSRLITGENPFSSKEMAKVVVQQLSEK